MSSFSISLDTMPGAWRGQWYVDENAVGDPIVVDANSAVRITGLSRAFAELFETGRRPIVSPEALHLLGHEMYDLWVAPVWRLLEPHLTLSTHTLLIRTTSPEALNLPWELVELGSGGPLGCDPAWRVFRSPLPKLRSLDNARPGPLRVLFLAAAPTDQASLDFEDEEEAITTLFARVQNVVLRIVDSGTADELAELVAEFQPHIVHLSGHGVVAEDGVGRFAFEDESGLTDERDVETLATDIFRGSSVRCVFLNACQTARAAVAGLAQHLVSAGVPHVLGWSASVADDRATDFAAEFYRRLVRGESLGAATAHAREHIRRAGLNRGAHESTQDATFALPQLYAATADDRLINRDAKPEPYEGPRTERFILGDNIKGLRTGYVGRRREGQKLVPPLRDGAKTFALLTGIGGAGKSTLATRAANRLTEAGFRAVLVQVAEEPDPATQGRAATLKLFTALATAFELESRPEAAAWAAALRDGKRPAAERFAIAAALLNEARFLVLLDNLEPALIVETREIADPDLAAGLRALATGVTRGSRVLVTCRYVPADMPIDHPNFLHIQLNDLPLPDVLKFLRREPRVDVLLSTGNLDSALLARLYDDFGGTPGFLEQVRTLLADPKLDVDALRDELESVDPGQLAAMREVYYDKIITSRLYAALSNEAQRVASRLSVSILPLPVDAVAKLADLTEGHSQDCLDSGVQYGLLQRFDAPNLRSLFQPPGLLQPWLSDPDRLPESDARQTHQRLAAFWQYTFQRDRESGLRMDWGLELEVCRRHAMLGHDIERWRWAALGLARHLQRISEWRRAYELIEEIPETQRDETCWYLLATIDMQLGNYAAAREKSGKSLSMVQAIGDKAGEAATWHNLASIDVHEGNYAAAREMCGKSLSIEQAIGDTAGEAATWHNLASIDLREGNYAAAREKFGKSLNMLQAIGDRAGEAAAWHNLAAVNAHEGNYTAAREKFGKSLNMLQAIGDRAGEAATWHQLASIDANEGNYAAAREKSGKSLSMLQAIGDKAGEAATWHQLATVDLREGNFAAAREKCGKSLSIEQAIGNKAGEAAAWHQLALIDLGEGNYAAAREKLGKSLTIQQAIGDKAGEAATWHNMASIDLNEGNYAASREKSGKSLSMRQAIGDKAGEAATWHQLASIDLGEGNYAAAREKFGKALSMLQAIGDKAGEAATWHQLATIDLKEGNYAAAREKFRKALTMRQAIGDKAGEAAAFFQLGMLANQLQRTAESAPLVALCWLIRGGIGHGDADNDLKSLSALCQKHDYDQAAYDAMIQRTRESYQKDRGRSLLKAAFPDWPD